MSLASCYFRNDNFRHNVNQLHFKMIQAPESIIPVSELIFPDEQKQSKLGFDLVFQFWQTFFSYTSYIAFSIANITVKNGCNVEIPDRSWLSSDQDFPFQFSSHSPLLELRQRQTDCYHGEKAELEIRGRTP